MTEDLTLLESRIKQLKAFKTEVLLERTKAWTRIETLEKTNRLMAFFRGINKRDEICKEEMAATFCTEKIVDLTKCISHLIHSKNNLEKLQNP